LRKAESEHAEIRMAPTRTLIDRCRVDRIIGFGRSE
jgi:hypothetical protein